jgi:hypothetical protein
VTYEDKLAACDSFENGSTIKVRPTTRLFIRLPTELYPFESAQPRFTTLSGDAGGGYISNGGLPGRATDSNEGCWGTYYGLDGEGQTDFQVISTSADVPAYVIHFDVQWSNPPR